MTTGYPKKLCKFWPFLTDRERWTLDQISEILSTLQKERRRIVQHASDRARKPKVDKKRKSVL